MEKDFNQWNHVKKALDVKTGLPSFRERQVWWCSIGMNVGYEMCGKGESFTRPVLILKKLGRATFIGIPLTSSRKDIPLFYPFSFKGREGALRLDQIRIYDARRLLNLIETIGDHRFQPVRQAVHNLL